MFIEKKRDICQLEFGINLELKLKCMMRFELTISYLITKYIGDWPNSLVCTDISVWSPPLRRIVFLCYTHTQLSIRIDFAFEV